MRWGRKCLLDLRVNIRELLAVLLERHRDPHHDRALIHLDLLHITPPEVVLKAENRARWVYAVLSLLAAK